MKLMWRRLVRYIAKRELDAVRLEYCAACVRESVASDSRERLAYLRGHAEGARAALAEVEKHLAERMAGGSDLINPEDLRMARKGMLH